MDALIDLLHGITKHVFAIIATVVLAMLLYILFFVGENSATMQASRAAETPLSNYYYSYAYYPSVHTNDGVAAELGYSSYDGVTDLSGDANIDNAGGSGAEGSKGDCAYTTGWR